MNKDNVESNFHTTNNTARMLDKRLNTEDDTPKNQTVREQESSVNAAALHESISKKIESHREDRDKLNNLNLDLDIPTS